MAPPAAETARNGSELAALLARSLGAPDAVAAEAIAKAGSISALLACDELQLAALGLDEGACQQALRIRDLMLEALRQPLREHLLLDNGDTLLAYLRARLSHQRMEMLLVLYVDAAFRLIDEAISVGTITDVAIYPSEIVRRALELRAAGLVLAHNHPSGDPAPSAEDRRITDRVAAASQALDLRLIDHIIIAGDAFHSFRGEGEL